MMIDAEIAACGDVWKSFNNNKENHIMTEEFKKIFVTAFSTNMFNMPEPLGDFEYPAFITLNFEKLHERDIRYWIRRGWVTWRVGHEATAAVLSRRYGVPVHVDRTPVVFPDHAGADVELVVIALGKRLDAGQILSEEEVERLPISFWGVMCEQYKPSAPILCHRCKRPAVAYNEEVGQYCCEEHRPDRTEIGESDNVRVRCMICKEWTTILESSPLLDATRRERGRICHLCDAELGGLNDE